MAPATTVPSWWVWQLSVPTIGLMQSDHRHPGRNVMPHQSVLLLSSALGRIIIIGRGISCMGGRTE